MNQSRYHLLIGLGLYKTNVYILAFVDLLTAGLCYEAIGQFDKAGALYEEALKLSRTQLPSGHPRLAEGKLLNAIQE